ncbi:MAG TPA: CCC motif membrane protein [Salinimicrobium sp.]|nr:CCC motif membrane protein [Salinimicrobium sp.]
MEKQTLPNSTLIIILAILSILSSCCGGIFGIIFSIVALVLCRKATKIYTEDPEIYSSYQNVRIGKILAIIGLVLGLVFLITLLVNLFFLG